jgi:hypothetical protein
MFQTLNLGTVAWLGWAGPLVADIVPVGRGRFQTFWREPSESSSASGEGCVVQVQWLLRRRRHQAGNGGACDAWDGLGGLTSCVVNGRAVIVKVN